MARLGTAAAALLVSLATPLTSAPALTSYGPALAPGDTVPTFTGTALDGTRTKVAWDGAKLNLVNFWATWCKPCREEMPQLEKLSRAHAADGLRVVGVLVGDFAKLPDVKSAVEAAGVTYPVVVAVQEGSLAFRGVAVIPTTFLLDSRGRVVRKYVGTSDEELAALSRDVADYLAGRPLGPPFIPESKPTPPPSPAPAGR